MTRSVVVTGIGIVAPLRPFEGVEAFWSALCAGEDAIRKRPLPLLDIEGAWPMAAIDTAGHGPVAPEDRLLFFAAAALRDALDDACLNEAERSAAGLFLGTVLGNVLVKEKRLLAGSAREERESLSSVAPHLAAQQGLRGPVMTVSTACPSGTDAIGIAARKIESGAAEIMIAGGADVLSDFALIGFHALQALTADRVRPFDRRRSGLALGEGAAFLALEAEDHAERRGARPWGRVLGYASRSDATHLTGPHKEGRGLAAAIEAALAGAAFAPEGVGYINAHGTGTPYNDLMETKAIKRIFGTAAYRIPVSSTKSMLGHSFGAAGVIEAACCLLALRSGLIPPTINYGEPDPGCDLDYVPNRARGARIEAALSLSAGFGGQNAALLLGAA